MEAFAIFIGWINAEAGQSESKLLRRSMTLDTKGPPSMDEASHTI